MTNREKAIELRKNGKTVRDIANMMELSESTIRKYVRGIEDLKQAEIIRNPNVVKNWNKNRIGCASCIYRARDMKGRKPDDSDHSRPGCNFILIKKQMRGCSVESCDVYQKGRKLSTTVSKNSI